MERFVIGAAIFAAALIAISGYFGHSVSDGDGLSFVIDGEGAKAGPGAPASFPARAFAAQELRVRNAVAVLKVVPEDRTDISIEIANPGKLAMPDVRIEGGVLTVDGGVSGRAIRACRNSNGVATVSVGRIGEITQAQMPTITAHVPRAVNVAAGGAVATSVGPSASAKLAFSGCGDATIADVAGPLELAVAGSGDVAGGAAQSAKASVQGSGDTSLGAIAGKLDVAVAGSGGVAAASLTGPLDVSIAGSGDVDVRGGAVANVDVNIAGSGGVNVAAPVQALTVSIAGSGDVDVKGAAASLEASIMGSGDVHVQSVAGALQKTVMGSGSVTVGP